MSPLPSRILLCHPRITRRDSQHKQNRLHSQFLFRLTTLVNISPRQPSLPRIFVGPVVKCRSLHGTQIILCDLTDTVFPLDSALVIPVGHSVFYSVFVQCYHNKLGGSYMIMLVFNPIRVTSLIHQFVMLSLLHQNLVGCYSTRCWLN